MSDVYSFHEGDLPVVVSVPHDGREIPGDIRARMTPETLAIPDTDWHVARLYDFVPELGASMIVARYSRYVVDLNRPPDDATLYAGQAGTGLCPEQTFAGEPVYRDSSRMTRKDIASRVSRYWRPYHDKLRATLNDFRARHGIALLWDAHSIPSRVPMLFDGELPVLNIGTWDERSCDVGRVRTVLTCAERSRYSTVHNGRFKGGFITRHYGAPPEGIHAIQLEVAQRAYMDEATARVSRGSRGRIPRDAQEPVVDIFGQ